MKIKLLAFGVAADLVGMSELELQLSTGSNIDAFKKTLRNQFPSLKKLNSYAIAVNESYVLDTHILSENDVVALIPPVSGG